MNKRLSYLVLALLCLGGGSVWAQEPVSFTIGDLKYTVIDAENRQVEVGAKDDTNVSGNITIPAQVTHAGTTYNVVRTCNFAFSGCEALTGITFSEGLVQINGASFEGCTNLASVSLPNTLTSIGGYGFSGCSSLKNLVIPGSVVAFPDAPGETFGGDVFNSITFESCATALPSNLYVNAKNVVLKRNGGQFRGVESVVIGGSATEISYEAFSGCTELSSVTIQSAISFIDSYAFWNCTSLKDFTIPASVTTLGADAFGYCVFDNLTIEQAASTLDFVGYKLSAVNAVVNRPTISNESGNLFYNHLQTLTVGGNVTSVPNNFVDGCGNLTTVTLGSSVTSIGNEAFKDCTKLTTIDIQGNVTSIGDRAFYQCNELSGISLQSTLQSIGGEAFYYCTSIKNLTVPSAVATLGNDAFAYCVFDNLVIEDSNTLLDLGDYSLNAHNAYIGRPMSSDRGEIFWNQAYNAEKFDGTLEIGGNVTTLTAQYAHNLSNMTKLILGNSVQSIAEKALGECSSLADMYVPWQTPLAINANVFENYYDQNTLPQNATLWVPAGTKAAYQAATGWNMFDNFQPTHYIVNLNTVGDGTLKVNDTATRVLVPYDATNIQFVLAAGEDYDFTKLNNGTADVYTPASQGATKNGGTYTLPNISDDMNFTATFTEKPLLSIMVYTTGAGSATISETPVHRDRDAYVIFAPGAGHELTSVTLNQVDVFSRVNNNRLDLTNIQEVQDIVAAFTLIHYTVSAAATTNGTIELASTDVQWSYGTTAAIIPATGYDVDHVFINGENADSWFDNETNTLHINSVKSNTVVSATFKKHPYTISAAATTNGTIELAATSVLYQEGTTATITPATGYDINEVTINGADAKSQLNGNTLTISNVTQNTVVAATFKKHAYTISAAATTNGTIELAATSVLYQEGTTATITPASGYMVETVTINGGENLKETAAFNKATGVLTISNVTANTTVAATFRIQSYEVHITGTGVTASNMYPQHGERVTITVAEDPERELTSLRVNGVEQKNNMDGNTYTINNVTGDVTVVATFRSTVESITVNQYGVGTYACSQHLDFTGSELKAYIAIGFNKTTNSVLLSRVYDVPAGTGIYLKGEPRTYKIPYANETNSYYVNMLVGNTGAAFNLAPVTGEMGNYVLSVDNNGDPLFYMPASASPVATKRAYLQIPLSFFDPRTNNAPVNIQFEEDMTGMEDIIFFGQQNGEAIYNLNGQKVNKADAGIHIINGKKVFIK